MNKFKGRMTSKFYEVQLLRTLVEGRIVKVKASGEKEARRKALKMARGEKKTLAGEYIGEWCDQSQRGKIKVRDVMPITREPPEN